MEKKEKIKITSRTCFACPTVYDLEFENGKFGLIKFRYGCISLYSDLDEGPLISEQISDKLDGVISLDEVKNWLENANYVVEIDDFVYNQLAGDYEI